MYMCTCKVYIYIVIVNGNVSIPVAVHSGTNITSQVPLICCTMRFQFVYILRSEKAKLAPKQVAE